MKETIIDFIREVNDGYLKPFFGEISFRIEFYYAEFTIKTTLLNADGMTGDFTLYTAKIGIDQGTNELKVISIDFPFVGIWLDDCKPLTLEEAKELIKNTLITDRAKIIKENILYE